MAMGFGARASEVLSRSPRGRRLSSARKIRRPKHPYAPDKEERATPGFESLALLRFQGVPGPLLYTGAGERAATCERCGPVRLSPSRLFGFRGVPLVSYRRVRGTTRDGSAACVPVVVESLAPLRFQGGARP
jgi:hypothetical protein